MRHRDTQPDLLALRVSSALWMRARTGTLRSQRIPGRAIFVRGMAHAPDDLRWLRDALYAGELAFSEGEVFVTTNVRAVHPLLWEHANYRANPRAVLDALDANLVVRCPRQRLRELSLAGPTRRLLEVPNGPRHSLSSLCRQAEVPAAEVAREISALIAMGAAKLRRPAGRGVSVPEPSSPITPPAPRVGTDMGAIALRRLQREWETVQKADDWTVIGANPRMPQETITRACARMQLRYTKLSKDARLPAEGRALAARIAERVNEAVGRIQQGTATRGGTDWANATADELLLEAKRLVREGKASQSTKVLALARQKSDDPEILAWFGYAMTQDSSRPAGRLDKGMDHLRLAASMGYDPANYLLARVESNTGDLVRAWNRLDAFLKRNPDHEAAAVLRDQVKRRARRNH